MGGVLFEEWIKELDCKLASAGRHIALLIDDCQTHLITDNLKAIDLHFFPPNTISKLQPVE